MQHFEEVISGLIAALGVQETNTATPAGTNTLFEERVNTSWRPMNLFTPTREALRLNPPSFAGELEECPREFLRRANKILAMYDEENKLYAMDQLLTGSALRWWNTHKALVKTFAQFEDELVEAFEDQSALRTAFDMDQQSPTESALSFIARQLLRWRRISPVVMEEEELVTFTQGQLLPEYQGLLFRWKPKTMRELRELLEEADRIVSPAPSILATDLLKTGDFTETQEEFESVSENSDALDSADYQEEYSHEMTGENCEYTRYWELPPTTMFETQEEQEIEHCTPPERHEDFRAVPEQLPASFVDELSEETMDEDTGMCLEQHEMRSEVSRHPPTTATTQVPCLTNEEDDSRMPVITGLYAIGAETLATESQPTRESYTLAVDVLGPYPKTAMGETNILVVQDTLERWVEAFPLKETRTSNIIRILEDKIFSRRGYPNIILTDAGSQFRGQRWTKRLRTWRADAFTTAEYLPRANPVKKRLEEIKRGLRTRLGICSSRFWAQELAAIISNLQQGCVVPSCAPCGTQTSSCSSTADGTARPAGRAACAASPPTTSGQQADHRRSLRHKHPARRRAPKKILPQ